jgi:hypothetical protein
MEKLKQLKKFTVKMKKLPLTSVLAVQLVGRFSFESYDSNFVWSAFSRDRSDPAKHAKH